MNNRRKLIIAIGAGALATPFRSFAQPKGKIWRVGFFGTAFASGYVNELEWIRTGLKAVGYEEGKNIVIEYRWAQGNAERTREIAAEFVTLKLDAIIAHGIPGALAAVQATSTIAVVMADGYDPVEAGLAASLARPGGNVTGSTSFVPEESAKRLELLKEVVPRITRVAFIVSAQPPPVLPVIRSALASAAALMKVELREFVMHEPADLPELFNSMTKARIEGAIINNEPLLNSQAAVIAALASVKQVPTIGYPSYVDAGGLLAYGSNRQALYTRVGYFLDRIFKGGKPGDIPFERASKFQLGVNLKTAKALGIRIPNSVLLRADKVIE